MTTTSLPDRLRAVANFIETHNLPEPISLSVSNDEFRAGTAHFDSHDAVCRWAEVCGETIDVREVDGSTGPPFTSYTFDASLPYWQWFTVAYYRFDAAVTA